MNRRATSYAVSEVMTSAPTTVSPRTTLTELIRLFDREHLDAVPVVDDEGLLCGIVTSLDLLRAVRPNERLAIPGPRSLAARRVESVMRPGVITLEPTDPIAGAIDLMVETRFHVLPVVKRGREGRIVVGIVHQRNLLRGLFGGPPLAAKRGRRPPADGLGRAVPASRARRRGSS